MMVRMANGTIVETSKLYTFIEGIGSEADIKVMNGPPGLNIATDVRLLGDPNTVTDFGPLIQEWHDDLPSSSSVNAALIIPAGVEITVSSLVKFTKNAVGLLGFFDASILNLDLDGGFQFGDHTAGIKTLEPFAKNIFVQAAAGHNAGTLFNFDFCDHSTFDAMRMTSSVASASIDPITGLRVGACQWFESVGARITQMNWRAVAIEAIEGNEGHINFSHFHFDISKQIADGSTAVDIINNSGSQIGQVSLRAGHIGCFSTAGYDTTAITTYGVRMRTLGGAAATSRVFTLQDTMVERFRKGISCQDASVINVSHNMFIGGSATQLPAGPGGVPPAGEYMLDAIDADASSPQWTIQNNWFHNVYNAISASGQRLIGANYFTSIRNTQIGVANPGALNYLRRNIPYGFAGLDSAGLLSASVMPSLVITGKTASYTAALADAGSLLTFTTTGASVLTIDTEANVAFPVGTVLFAQQEGAGQLQVVGASGVTVIGPAGTFTRTLYSQLKITKMTANSWRVSGDATNTAITVPTFRAGSTSGQILAATTAGSVNLPAGVQIGDLLVLAVDDGGSTDTIATPSGWGLVQGPIDTTGTGTQLRTYVFSRVADGSEGTSVALTKTGTNATWRASMVAYSGSAGVDVSSAQAVVGAGDTSPIIPSVTPTVANSTLIAVVASRVSGIVITPPAGWTEVYSVNTGGNPSIEFCQLTPVSTSPTGSATATASASTKWATIPVVAKHP